MAGSSSEVLKSLAANLVIAAAKGVAAVITGSGAMLAETLHSLADCANQILLLVGIHRSAKPADEAHPLGYGREMYFYSFIVALLLFLGGGVFSIYEGIHKLGQPEAVGDIRLALGILAFAFLLEGWATLGNIRTLNQRRGDTPFLRYLRESKDSDLVVVFGENSAAVLGLVFAFVALLLAKMTGDGRWDAIGSLAIGVVLVGVAVFLAGEIKALLVGEAADSKILRMLGELAIANPNVERVFNVITLQQGPGEVVVLMKLRMREGLATVQVCDAINGFEREIRAREPAIKWSYIEPDHSD